MNHNHFAIPGKGFRPFTSRLRTVAVLLMPVVFLAACAESEVEIDRYAIPEVTGSALTNVPDWSRNAVWYQVMVERFRNGDERNDPDLEDMAGAWPDIQPDRWAPSSWSHDWYRQEEWADSTGENFYRTVQLRRYGGDLQGVIDRLDYLADLGINALYLNPVNDAPSLHKYDARFYHHVDRNFGPDPDGDLEIMQQEDPSDPDSWQWTAADRLFLDLVAQAKRRGIRVVMDYSWNHTGKTFWAFRDLVENQASSVFSGWYEVDSWDDPITPDSSEFVYQGWAGVPELPVLKKVDVSDLSDGKPFEGNLAEGPRNHILDVTRRWLDPNGDGNPDDGIDGFRLDAAEQVPLGFWRDYRKFVKNINPDALLIGEIWWEKWPDTLADPGVYLQGDMFDGVMNYRWFKEVRDFVLGGNASQFVAQMDSLDFGINQAQRQVVWNVASTHDTPRLGTSLMNGGPYKTGTYRARNPAYITSRPDTATLERQRVLLAQQFTYSGAPHIWYGEEVGMWGADDPDNRKPMVWPDMKYESEAVVPEGQRPVADSVFADMRLRDFYQQLISMRKANPDLFVDGSLETLVATDGGVLVYRRQSTDRMAVVFLNASDNQIPMSGNIAGNLQQEMLFRNPLDPEETYSVGGDMPVLSFGMEPRSFKILISE